METLLVIIQAILKLVVVVAIVMGLLNLWGKKIDRDVELKIALRRKKAAERARRIHENDTDNPG